MNGKELDCNKKNTRQCVNGVSVFLKSLVNDDQMQVIIKMANRVQSMMGNVVWVVHAGRNGDKDRQLKLNINMI